MSILCLFPDECEGFFRKGLMKKALDRALFSIKFINIREFATDKHNKVDDYPFGHKQGMLLKADVLAAAIRSIENYKEAKIVYTSPQGKSLSSTWAKTRAKSDRDIIIIVGYFEGVDSRVLSLFDCEEISVGDFILTSGELPALTIVEAIVRYIPGVIGNEDSVENESVLSGVLEAPQYTHPREVEGCEVPELLRSGNHKRIDTYERRLALEKTLFKRPDLLALEKLSENEKEYLVDSLSK